MKKIIILFSIIFILFSCGVKNKYETGKKLSVENDRKIKNEIIVDTALYSKTTEITFHDPKDIENFKKELETINKKIDKNNGKITPEQIIEKARLLDYLGKTGEGLKLYVENFTNDGNDKYFAYNNNLAGLYYKLGAYEMALNRYDFLINYFNDKKYLKEKAEVYKSLGDTENEKKTMEEYNKIFKKEEVQEIQVK